MLMQERVPALPSVTATIYVFLHTRVSSWYVSTCQNEPKRKVREITILKNKILKAKHWTALSYNSNNCSGITPRMSLTLCDLITIYFMLVIHIHFFFCKPASNLICRCAFQIFTVLPSWNHSLWVGGILFIHKLERYFFAVPTTKSCIS